MGGKGHADMQKELAYSAMHTVSSINSIYAWIQNDILEKVVCVILKM